MMSSPTETALFQAAEARVLDRYGSVLEPVVFELPGGRSGRALIGGEGTPLVLVPGGGMPAAGWAPLAEHLRGFRLIVLELPGFGLGDRLSLRGTGLRPAAVHYLVAALDAFAVPRAHVVANSMGGLWALWLALDRPERLASVSLMGCPALLLGTSAPFGMRLVSVPGVGPFLLRLRRPTPRGVERALASAGVDITAHEEVRDLVVALERLPSSRRAWSELLAAALRLRGARPGPAMTEEDLARVEQPVQFVWGTEDPFGAPAVGERAVRLMPDAELQVIPGGHAPWLQDANRAADLLKAFLVRSAFAS